MDDREYIEREAKLIYGYIIQDKEKFDNKKHLYARILNSIKSTAECQIGGIESLEISLDEIKEIIKLVVGNYKED